MPNRAYSDDERLAVVAFAEVSGAPAAASHFGVNIETVRIWQRDAPKSSALGRAVELALSKVTVALAGGKVRPRDAAVMYGILRDKAARYDRPAVDDEPDGEAEDAELQAIVDAEVIRRLDAYPEDTWERDVAAAWLRRLVSDVSRGRTDMRTVGEFLERWTPAVDAALPRLQELRSELREADENDLSPDEAVDACLGPISLNDPVEVAR